jgi:hypothetical protein
MKTINNISIVILLAILCYCTGKTEKASINTASPPVEHAIDMDTLLHLNPAFTTLLNNSYTNIVSDFKEGLVSSTCSHNIVVNS